MTKSKVLILGVCLIAQLLLLFGEYANSVYPHYYGEEVLLEIKPVDPRSLFRGQYARLNYTIGTIEFDDFKDVTDESFQALRQGEFVYASLMKRSSTTSVNQVLYYEIDTVTVQQPETGLFVRGRVVKKVFGDSVKPISVKYGIEAFFTTPEKALEVEEFARQNPDSSYAKVMVAPNGKAALVDVLFVDGE